MNSPHLTLANVTEAAQQFLKTYHPSLDLPIPIEEIIELQMKISLSVVPGIKDLLGIDSFITSDFSKIVIDEFAFNNYTTRTRFSIAHEIGHLVLHKEWYQHNGPANLDNYLEFHDKIDPEIYKHTEIQASTFAGLILVPQKPLFDQLKQRLGRIPQGENPEALITAIQDLPEIFQVSDAVILRRLQKEGLVKSNS